MNALIVHELCNECGCVGVCMNRLGWDVAVHMCTFNGVPFSGTAAVNIIRVFHVYR